jgi:SPP1 gp7 family putative phage head morphogenesis protein
MPIGLGPNFTKPWPAPVTTQSLGADIRHQKTRERTKRAFGVVRPSMQIAEQYRHKLVKLIEQMHNSIMYWLSIAYKRTEPQREVLMAMDATAAERLQKAINKLAKRWQKRFDQLAEELAKFFAKKVKDHTDKELHKILKRGGMEIEFTMSKGMRETLGAIVKENVSLIKSIPSKHFTQIEGMVMRSILAGYDTYGLQKELEHTFRVTKNRASLIARDQTRKASSAIQRIRYLENGINEAIWMHSHGGRQPRKTHLANDGKKFDVSKGWFDPDPKVRKHIMPGQLINCRCYFKPVLPIIEKESKS